MADMEFEPLHDGDDEENEILERRPKEKDKKHTRSKSTPMFKKNIDKRDKGDYSRPVPASMMPQRPIQGLVGPGDSEFSGSPPDSESPLGLSLAVTASTNASHSSTNGTTDSSKNKKPHAALRQVQIPPLILPQNPHQSSHIQRVNPAPLVSSSLPKPDYPQQRPEKLTLLTQARRTNDSPNTPEQRGPAPGAVTSNAYGFKRDVTHLTHDGNQSPIKSTTEEGLWSPPSGDANKRFSIPDYNWANFGNVPNPNEPDKQQGDPVESADVDSDDSRESDTEETGPVDQDTDDADVWQVTDEQKEYYTNQFNRLQPSGEPAVIKGAKARDFFLKSTLPTEILSKIWHLSDINKDRALDINEFCIAMHLVVAVRHGLQLPAVLPQSLLALTGASPAPVIQTVRSSKSDVDVTPPRRRRASSVEAEKLPTSPTEQWAVFSTPKKEQSPANVPETLPPEHSGAHVPPPAFSVAPHKPAHTPPHLPTQTPPHLPTQTPPHLATPVYSTRESTSPLVSPTAKDAPSPQDHKGPQAKKMSMQIARPRVSLPVVNLLDSHPAQLLPPPSTKVKPPKPGPINKLHISPGASPVSSPLRKLGASPIPESVVHPTAVGPDSQVVSVHDVIDGGHVDAAKSPTDAAPTFKPVALPRPQKTSIPVQTINIEKQVERRRSSCSSDSSIEDITPEGVPVEIEQADLDVPPTPPPRRTHGRSSSLDLNKIFGSKQQASPGSGRPLGNRTVSQDSLSSTCSQTRSQAESAAEHDAAAKLETDKFADFEKFPTPDATTAGDVIARPRPLPTHRRSVSLDWAKKASVLPEGGRASESPFPTNVTGDRHTMQPKRPAPQPPAPKPEKPPPVEVEEDASTKVDPKKSHPPSVIIRPLEKKSKRQELEETIKQCRDRNTAASSINRDLQNQLRELMTDRAALEMKLDGLKPADVKES